jgi:hypothetical protein
VRQRTSPWSYRSSYMRYQVNSSVDAALGDLSGGTLVLRLDYRALTHPFSGTAMAGPISDLVQNGLQRVLMTARSRSSTALAVSPSTYFLFDDAGGPIASQRKFMRLSRELSKDLVSQAECGLAHGIPFWGSLSASESTGEELRRIASQKGSTPAAFAQRLAEAPRPPNVSGGFQQSATNRGFLWSSDSDAERVPANTHVDSFSGRIPGSPPSSG